MHNNPQEAVPPEENHTPQVPIPTLQEISPSLTGDKPGLAESDNVVVDEQPSEVNALNPNEKVVRHEFQGVGETTPGTAPSASNT